MPPRSTSAAGFPALKVVFNRRMKQNRVYPVTVSWGEKPRPLGTVKNVTVRLLGAGAQIVPSEQALDATKPDLKATFFVTPLAYGWLRAQRLEILVAGRKVQEVPLASKVTCQCWAAFWFIMAFVLPALLIWWRSGDPFCGQKLIRENVPAMPAFVTNSVPVVGEYWDKFWAWKGEAYAAVWAFNYENLIAFPLFVGLLLWTLLLLFTHRDKTARRWSQPIPIPAGAASDD